MEKPLVFDQCGWVEFHLENCPILLGLHKDWLYLAKKRISHHANHWAECGGTGLLRTYQQLRL